jgi:hypothetical protein
MPKTTKYESDSCDSSESDNECNNDSTYDSDFEQKTNIKEIIFKKINDKYSYGKYGSFNVIMMIDNGYINATKLCEKVDKEFRHWKENKSANEIIDELTKTSGIEKQKLMIITTGNVLGKIKGTYVHPDLIPQIASWASPRFAIKVSKIVNEYFAKKALDKKDAIIAKKDDKIDKLEKKIDLQLEKIDSQSEKIDELKKINNRILRTNTKIQHQNENILEKLERVCIDRVIPTGCENDVNHLILVKNNPDPEEYYDYETLYDYSVLRIMKGNVNTKLSKHKARYPEMKLLLDINGSPNSVILWKRIKNNLGKNIIVSGCNFNLRKKNYRQNDLIQDIRDMHDERLNVDSDDD